MLRRGFPQDGSGVVEEDVDRRLFRLDRGDPPVERRPVGEVALVRRELAPERAHLLFGFTSRPQRGGDADDVRARFGQSDGDPLTDAAGTAGDDGGFAVEFELIENHVHASFRQRINIFIASGACPRYSNAFCSSSSGKTRLISRSNGSSCAATSAIARSKSSCS